MTCVGKLDCHPIFKGINSHYCLLLPSAVVMGKIVPNFADFCAIEPFLTVIFMGSGTETVLPIVIFFLCKYKVAFMI